MARIHFSRFIFKTLSASSAFRFHWVLCVLAVGLSFAGEVGAATKKPVSFTSNFSAATVFRDLNKNGLADANEPSSTTAADGRFIPPKGKGRLYLSGGIEILTGQPNSLLLSSPDGARAIGTLTALWQALHDRKQGNGKIGKLLLLPPNTTVSRYAAVPIEQTAPNSLAEKLVKINAQQTTLAQLLKSLAKTRQAVQTLPRSAYAEDPAIAALADTLIRQAKTGLDIANADTVQAILAGGLAELNSALGADDLRQVSAAAATALNTEIGKLTARQPQALRQLQQERAKGSAYLAAGDFAGFRNYFFPAPKITALSVDTGLSATDGITRDNTPTLSGIAPPNSTRLRIYRNDMEVAEITPDGNGNWSYASPPLADGVYAFGLAEVMSSGLDGTISNILFVTVDTAAPSPPTVDPLATTLSTPTLTGTWSGQSGDSLGVSVNGRSYTAANGLQLSAAGWSLAIPASDALATGSYDVTVREEDLAGNGSAGTGANALQVNPLPVPAISSLTVDTGVSNSDGITNDTTPILAGSIGNGAGAVNVYRNGSLVWPHLGVNSGQWSYSEITPLGDGTYRYSVTGVNSAGQEGAASPSKLVTILTVPPAAPTVNLLRTGSLRPTLTGTWVQTAGNSLSVNVNGQTYTAANGLIATATAWSLHIPHGAGLNQGSTEVVARVTDPAGNSTVDSTHNELAISLLAPASTVNVGNIPKSIGQGDFNLDGKLDLATANEQASTVSVLLGNGDGTFKAKVDYASGAGPNSVTVADLNGDGKPDLATANNYTGTVSVLLGNGDGTFKAKLDSTTGADPVSIAWGDFNGDGRPDLVTTNSFSNAVSVLLGNGDGTFKAKVDYATGANPLAVAVGDLNGDGKADLAVANANANSASILLGKGDGTFKAKVDYGTGVAPFSVAMGDLNGDGKPDLATANEQAGTVGVLLGNGDGTFAAAGGNASTGTNPWSVVAGDFNGDGKPDLVTANSGANSLSILLGNGDGTFKAKFDYAAGSIPQSVVVGDFNGDGKPDLAVANEYDSTVSVLPGTGDGSFQAKRDYAAGGASLSIVLDDVNGDGKPDLATANANNTVSVLLGNGDGSFQARLDSATGTGPQALAAGDFNGDGKPDLATANYLIGPYGSISILLGHGDGTFTATGANTIIGRNSWSVAVGDLNGDGKLDFATANAYGGSVSVLLGKGDGSFLANVDYAVGTSPQSVAVGDLDGDGRLDLATANAGANSLSILSGNGDGTFKAKVDHAAGGSPQSIVASDLNGDGKLDLATANANNSVSVLLGNGDGTVKSNIDYATGANPLSVKVGDFNGDGKPDLATANANDNSVSVLLGNGDGSFQDTVAHAAGTGLNPYSVVVGDLNGDGLPDIATANYQADTVSVLLNNWP